MVSDSEVSDEPPQVAPGAAVAAFGFPNADPFAGVHR